MNAVGPTRRQLTLSDTAISSITGKQCQSCPHPNGGERNPVHAPALIGELQQCRVCSAASHTIVDNMAVSTVVVVDSPPHFLLPCHHDSPCFVSLNWCSQLLLSCLFSCYSLVDYVHFVSSRVRFGQSEQDESCTGRRCREADSGCTTQFTLSSTEFATGALRCAQRNNQPSTVLIELLCSHVHPLPRHPYCCIPSLFSLSADTCDIFHLFPHFCPFHISVYFLHPNTRPSRRSASDAHHSRSSDLSRRFCSGRSTSEWQSCE